MATYRTTTEVHADPVATVARVRAYVQRLAVAADATMFPDCREVLLAVVRDLTRELGEEVN